MIKLKEKIMIKIIEKLKSNNVTRGLAGNAGMTLIEILIALAIMITVGTFVGLNVMDKFHEGRVSSSKIQISNFGNVLDDFARDIGRYPTTAEGLEALVENPGLKNWRDGGYTKKGKIPLDPWGNEFVYTAEEGGRYKIISYGADGEEGGEGKAADIEEE
jgi:general secretion pathway protein G